MTTEFCQRIDAAATLIEVRAAAARHPANLQCGELHGTALQHSGPLALVELRKSGAPASYVAGTENFYVITRYNWSSYCALAVIELG